VQAFLVALYGAHTKHEIGAIERPDVGSEGMTPATTNSPQSQDRVDIRPHIDCGATGQSDGLRPTELPPRSAQATIRGSEVVTPFADTMGLIDGHEGGSDPHRLKFAGESDHPLRRRVQEFDFTSPNPAQNLLLVALAL